MLVWTIPCDFFMELNTFFNVQERNGQNNLCMTSSGASANVATLGDICLL